MSWRSSGSRQRPSSSASGRGPSSIWDAGSAGGPPLIALIAASIVAGLVGLGLAFAFSGGAGMAGAPGVPAATVPTEAPVLAPTEAPAQEPTAAPAAGGEIPTAPLGPALAEGEGEPLSIGSDGEQLAFDNVALTAPEGLVTLTFVNNSSAVQHNWVLVDGGDDVAAAINDAALAQSSAARNPAAALPPADTEGLLVATHQINPGEEVTVTFETPAPGTYTFLCTFPGHYQAGMVGELTVE